MFVDKIFDNKLDQLPSILTTFILLIFPGTLIILMFYNFDLGIIFNINFLVLSFAIILFQLFGVILDINFYFQF